MEVKYGEENLKLAWFLLRRYLFNIKKRERQVIWRIYFFCCHFEKFECFFKAIKIIVIEIDHSFLFKMIEFSHLFRHILICPCISSLTFEPNFFLYKSGKTKVQENPFLKMRAPSNISFFDVSMHHSEWVHRFQIPE